MEEKRKEALWTVLLQHLDHLLPLEFKRDIPEEQHVIPILIANSPNLTSAWRTLPDNPHASVFHSKRYAKQNANDTTSLHHTGHLATRRSPELRPPGKYVKPQKVEHEAEFLAAVKSKVRSEVRSR